ncbi:hypothetical protein AD934_01800, partial [Gluconobacter oxydans]
MNTTVSPWHKLEMFDGIGDPRLRPVSSCFFQGAIEQLPRRPHEWPSLKILLISRLFADKDEGTSKNRAFLI